MTLADSAQTYRRLRAPQEDRTTLVEPPWDAVTELLEANRGLYRDQDCDIGGRTLSRLAADARGEFLKAARCYTSSYRDIAPSSEDGPIFLTGHQPAIFHPGVWFKNFASSALARRHGGVAVNLLIDADTVRNAALRVPGGGVDSPTTRMIAFDQPSAEIPYEEREIVDYELLGSFRQRAGEQIRPLVPSPMLEEFWPLVERRARVTRNLGLSLAQGRHLLEERLGLSTLEIPQSQICELPAAVWWITHVLLHAAQFREIYNRSVTEYRKMRRIRSLNHPVPELAAEGDWVETPFWIWQSSSPRRRGLFVRRSRGEILLADRHGLEIRLPITGDGEISPAVGGLLELRRRGIKLRTRALSTTMLARLLLGDLFLHGIGGAKYDQLTDVLIERFFGLRPPGLMVLSATLQLPVARAKIAPQDARRVEQMLRALKYHPEKYVNAERLPPESARAARRLIDRKTQLVGEPATVENARRRCHEIRRANQALQTWLVRDRQQLESQRDQMGRQLRAAATLGWREYGFCLYPTETLREFYAGVSL